MFAFHRLSIVFVVVAAAPLARAQPEAPREERPKQLTGTVAAMAFVPVGDAENIAEPSGGVRASLAFRVIPRLAIVGSADYTLAVKTDNLPRRAELAFYSLDIGARVQTPTSLPVDVFAEALVGRHVVRLALDGVIDSNSGLGLRAGAGAIHARPTGLTLTAQVSYTTSEIEDSDLDAVLVEAGAGWTF